MVLVFGFLKCSTCGGLGRESMGFRQPPSWHVVLLLKGFLPQQSAKLAKRVIR